MKRPGVPGIGAGLLDPWAGGGGAGAGAGPDPDRRRGPDDLLLARRALAVLEGHADASDAALAFGLKGDARRAPNYYDALLSWHAARGDWRGAAGTLERAARRIGEDLRPDTPAARRLRADLLDAAAAALDCLPAEDRFLSSWLEEQVSSLLAAADPHAAPVARKRSIAEALLDGPADPSTAKALFATPMDLRRAALLLRARASVAECCGPALAAASSSLSAPSAAVLLARARRFDDAVALCRAFDADLAPVVAQLAVAAVMERRSGGGGGEAAAKMSLDGDMLRPLDGAGAGVAERQLRLLLEAADGPRRDFALHVRALDVYCGMREAGEELPAWLLDGFLKLDPNQLVRRLLDYGCAAEAAEAALQLLRQREMHRGSAFVSHDTMDRVLLHEGVAPAARGELEALLRERFAMARDA